jgi:hypothetical protein
MYMRKFIHSDDFDEHKNKLIKFDQSSVILEVVVVGHLSATSFLGNGFKQH